MEAFSGAQEPVDVYVVDGLGDAEHNFVGELEKLHAGQLVLMKRDESSLFRLVWIREMERAGVDVVV